MAGAVRWWTKWAAASVVAALGGCGDDTGQHAVAWAESSSSEGGGGTADTTTSTTTTGSEPCEPGDTQECLCDDGLHLGETTCEPDGSGFGPCICDDGTTGGEGGAESSTGGLPSEVCYPGEDNAWTTCVPLSYPEPTPAGYEYPAPLNGDPNYRAPIAYLDLEAIDGELMVAPNFRLNELAQADKGKWGVVQPHAVASLQVLRDAVGGISVTSGYRSPEYNAGIGGVMHSRHMYGDGFDLDPIDVGLAELEAQCTSAGGMLVEYDTHVHCDFRFDDVDEEFFGPPGAPVGPADPGFSAELLEDDGVYTVVPIGFDEGLPRIRWTARDASGAVLHSGEGLVYVRPARAAVVEVDVGRAVTLRAP